MASGKGGTGKTTIAVNLVLYLAKSYKVALFDLDVEEPNDNHFLHYNLIHHQDVNVLRPAIDESIAYKVLESCSIRTCPVPIPGPITRAEERQVPWLLVPKIRKAAEGAGSCGSCLKRSWW